MHVRTHSRLAVAGSLATAATLLVGCAGTPPQADQDPQGENTIEIVTALYPLEYLATRIGGDAVTVINLTPAGAEAHDLELAPTDIFTMEASDLVVTLSNFSAAVDIAAAEINGPVVLDVGPVVNLRALNADDHAGDDHTDEAGDAHAHDHDHGIYDPHFWLDPERMILAAEALTGELSDLAPASTAHFEANLDELRAELLDLDAAYASSLAACEHRTLITPHSAFGYLADKFDLREVPIAGIDPETEPSPARLADIREEVLATGTQTIFAETQASAKSVETLADELGVTVLVLDPIETMTTPGQSYLDAMNANLSALQAGLGCQ